MGSEDKLDISAPELFALEASLREALIVIGRIKKRRNAYVTAVKVKERGSHVGRPRKTDVKRIAKLRAKGLTIRKVAEIEGVSATAVQRALAVASTATDDGKETT